MTEFIKRRLPTAFFRNIFLDLEDRCSAEALKAHEMVRDHASLDKKRSRELEGQARFRMMEKGFQEVCELHGGQLLSGGIVPGTDFKVFQPFMRFENNGQGVILGLASISEPGALPVKNKSRLAGVTLNYRLEPHFDFDGKGPKDGDIFIVFLASRDRERAGRLEEIAVGAINSKHDQYLYYEPLNKYLEGHADTPTPSPIVPSAGTANVRLKSTIRPFIPPEAPNESDQEINKNE